MPAPAVESNLVVLTSLKLAWAVVVKSVRKNTILNKDSARILIDLFEYFIMLAILNSKCPKFKA